MGWQSDGEPGPGADEPGPGEPGPGEPLNPGIPGSPGQVPRGARFAGFARGGEWDSCVPSAALAVALEGASGPDWRCAGAARDELFGVLRRWASLESWAVAGKLAVLRALMREEDLPLPGGGHHGDLPDEWSRSLTHEVSLALAMPPQSADKLMWLAWDMEAVLPRIGSLLADGTLTYAKAKAVDEAFAPLSEPGMAKAEAMIAPQLAGKTYSQVEKLAVQAAMTVDPQSAARRREDAERNRARVGMRREPSGAAGLAGYDLPTDETLAAHARVCARAQEYKDSVVFPDVRMDQLRAQAYLDILNGIPAEVRIASGQPDTGLCAPGEYASGDAGTPAGAGSDGPDTDGPDVGGPDGSAGGHPGDGCPDRDRDDDDEAGGPSGAAHAAPLPPAPSPSSGPGPASRSSPPAPRLADLVIPLATLLGLAWRPGVGHGLGPLDPDLCRVLAAAVVISPHSTLCVTVTDEHGYAIGHGCARRSRRRRPRTKPSWTPANARAALPARLNLTISGAFLEELTQAGTSETPGPPGPPVPGAWSFTRTGDPGPPGGHGTWELTLPDGRILTVKPEPVPTYDCDHRRESGAYKPSDTLRHLVQVRDYECTFPTCSRHARESDFEHAIPYHNGGRTCGCNAGARSRRCHQVKQSPGWDVAQPRPGWHQWETPSGRVYLQEPKRYPV